jgi:hypothetical protein
MTTHQARDLGLALIAWSEGKTLEVRDVLSADKRWFPFDPESYEQITTREGIEWRTEDRSEIVVSKFKSDSV